MTAPAATGFAEMRDGSRLFYAHAGRPDAPRVALVHSLALDASVWDDVVEEIAEETSLLTYDCRGHGRSDRPAGPYSVELFADDLAGLLDHVGWGTVILAGCSMGGCVVQAFAARCPERVAGMALVDTTAWYGPSAPADWRERAAKAVAEGFAAMSAFQTTRWFSDAFTSARPERVEALMAVFRRNDPAAYAASCAMLGDADLRGALSGFRAPAAVIVGEEDYATPVAHAERLRDSIPDATLRILPGARHLTPVERPSEIAAAIAEIVRRAAQGDGR